MSLLKLTEGYQGFTATFYLHVSRIFHKNKTYTRSQKFTQRDKKTILCKDTQIKKGVGKEPEVLQKVGKDSEE